jgi:hypothetical protein
MDLLAHCPYCGGDGRGEPLPDDSGYAPCLTCDGTGKIEVVPSTTHQGAVEAVREHCDTVMPRDGSTVDMSTIAASCERLWEAVVRPSQRGQ